jgi:methionyl-tRNA formyltransferase
MCSDLRPTPKLARVLLIGVGPTAAPALESLLERHDVIALVRAAGSNDVVVQRALAAGVHVHNEASVAAISALMHEKRPDCVVVSSFNRILPAQLLGACPIANVHYSPLPRYRGRANVNWAIINGESEAAITIHELVPDLDAGGVLYQERVPIGPRTTATELYGVLNGIQQRELGAAVARLLSGDHGTAQDDVAATYGCTRLPDDGEIDWAASTAVADRLVRGLTRPAPGAFTYLGLQRLWVDVAEPMTVAPLYEGRIPGRVVRVAGAQGHVDVLTGDGILRLRQVRLGDGLPVPAASLVRSVKTTLGLRHTDLLRAVVHLNSQVAALGAGADTD